MWHTGQILEILDRACDTVAFPQLDNPYVALAATRLSLHRSDEDWAFVFEVFGASRRAALPDLHLTTIASRLYDPEAPDRYATATAWDEDLLRHPHDEDRFVWPIAEGSWMDGDHVAPDADAIVLRGSPIALPPLGDYARRGILLERPPRVSVAELCRWLADAVRDEVLATSAERRANLRPPMAEILVLDAWHHPDLADPEDRPSSSPTFQQLADVLRTGDPSRYHPTLPPNNDWRSWPASGSL